MRRRKLVKASKEPEPSIYDTPENEEDVYQRILAIGGAGSGKTTSFLSLPGKKFIYIFDPSCKASLDPKKHGIDFREFMIDIKDLDISAKSLTKDKGDRPFASKEPLTYVRWESDFEQRIEDGFFNDYDWIGFDSFTMWADALMDRVLFINQRLGRQPQQDDWAAQITTIRNVFRIFTSMGNNIYCTAHTELRQDEVSKKVYGHIMLPGRMRVVLPLLFTNIFAFFCDSDEKTERFILQTRPDRENPVIRTTIKGIQFFEDVTINNFEKPEQYGLGQLLQKADLLHLRSDVTKSKRSK